MTDMDPNTGPEPEGQDDERSDIEQVVQARADAVARGEGGTESQPMTAPGEYSGVSGDGGVVKNQDLTQQ